MKVNYYNFKLENKDCFCPEESFALSTFANTPEWLRRFCYEWMKPEGVIDKSELKKQIKNYFMNARNLGVVKDELVL